MPGVQLHQNVQKYLPRVSALGSPRCGYTKVAMLLHVFHSIYAYVLLDFLVPSLEGGYIVLRVLCCSYGPSSTSAFSKLSLQLNREPCVRVTSENVELGRRVMEVEMRLWRESSLDSWRCFNLKRRRPWT